ncbi:MAG TPA: DUF2341 domain-containing protein [Methanocella sp.]|nr:DUF2341 domain-containing protein [Methanocella sp.]
MSYTPFYLGDPHYENPSLRVSNDGYNWVKLPGEPDPIIPEPAIGFNSDPSIQLIGNTLYLFYRYGNDAVTPTTVYINYTTTTDGVHWTTPVQTDLTWVLSQTVLYNGTGWQAWAFDENSSSHFMKYYTSQDGATFNYIDTAYLAMPAGSTPWHGEVKCYNGVYYLLCAVNPGNYAYSLYFYWSTDGINWYSEPNNPVLKTDSLGWDGGALYKSTFALVDNTWRVWYAAHDTGNHWFMGYAETSGVPTPILSSSASGFINNGFNYGKNVGVFSNTVNLSYYDVKIVLHNTTGVDTPTDIYLGDKVNSNWSDIMFNQSLDGADTNTILPYWFETTATTPTSVTVWLNMSSIDVDGRSGFWLYYNSTTQKTHPDITSTFPFGDDFSGDLSKWTVSGSANIQNGRVIVSSTGTASEITSTVTFPTGYALMAYTKPSAYNLTSKQISIGMTEFTDGNGYGSIIDWDDNPAVFADILYNKMPYGFSATRLPNVAYNAIWNRITLTRDGYFAGVTINDVRTASHDYYYTGDTKVNIRVANAGSSIETDWVAVRQWTDAEPTIEMPGPEVQTTPSATPTVTPTVTPSVTPTVTPSVTPTVTPVPTSTPTVSLVITSNSQSNPPSISMDLIYPHSTLVRVTVSPTPTPIATPIAEPSANQTATPIASPSATPTGSASQPVTPGFEVLLGLTGIATAIAVSAALYTIRRKK